MQRCILGLDSNSSGFSILAAENLSVVGLSLADASTLRTACPIG